MRQLVPHQVVPCESFAAIGGRNSTPLPLSARRRRHGRGTAETDPLAKTFRHRGRRLTLCFCSNSAPRRAHHSVRAAQPHAELLRAAVSVSAFTRDELRFATQTGPTDNARPVIQAARLATPRLRHIGGRGASASFE